MFRMSMAARFKIGAGLSICILVFFGFFSVYHMYFLSEEIQTALQSDMELISFSETTSKLFLKVRVRTLEYFQSGKKSLLDEISEDLVKVRAALKTRRDFFADGNASAARLLDSLKRQVDEFGEGFEGLGSGTTQPVPSAYYSIHRGHDQILETLRQFQDMNFGLFSEHQSNISGFGKAFQTRIAVVAIVTIVIAILLSIFFSQQIALPTRRLRDLINSIRDGNYQVSIRSDAPDEIGMIFNALAHMAEHIAVRDRLKIDKIGLEKRRFAALGNFLDVPAILVNDAHQVAFANNACLELFKMTWDDLYEVDLAQVGFPQELKTKILESLKKEQWPQSHPMDLIGENYAYEFRLSVVPVRNEGGKLVSAVCLFKDLDNGPVVKEGKG